MKLEENLEKFISKYNGKKVDFDKAFGAQCVDLARQWIKEGLEISEHTGSCQTTGGAKDLFLDYDKMPVEKKYFKKIYYSFDFRFSKFCPGDLLIWDSTPNNKYGHVAICVANLSENLIVFEQDGIKQDGAKINIRSKKNLLGLLRKK